MLVMAPLKTCWTFELGFTTDLKPETSNIAILVSPKCSEPARRTDMQRKN